MEIQQKTIPKMDLVQPPPVCPGDKVAVVLPAGPVEPDALDTGVAWLKTRYDPIGIGENPARHGYFAGTDEHRLAALQDALDNDNVRAVFAGRGGYGTTRILDRLNLDSLVRSPKWIVGSSDLTALLTQLYAAHGIPTIHGPMVFKFAQAHEHDLKVLIDLLEGRPWTPPPDLEAQCPGKATGPFIGGNLTMLAHLMGTLPPCFAKGAILFLEDIGEQPYRLDRCITQLRRAGVLDSIAGIVLGAFTDCQNGPDGLTARDVLADTLDGLGIPIATGYPAAHGNRNYPFIHGQKVTLHVQNNRARLSFDNGKKHSRG